MSDGIHLSERPPPLPPPPSSDLPAGMTDGVTETLPLRLNVKFLAPSSSSFWFVIVFLPLLLLLRLFSSSLYTNLKYWTWDYLMSEILATSSSSSFLYTNLKYWTWLFRCLRSLLRLLLLLLLFTPILNDGHDYFDVLDPCLRVQRHFWEIERES